MNGTIPIHPNPGWFKASRGEEPLELIAANPLAYVLAAMIAHRARWRAGFNRHQLELGEAFLGDYARYGMTERQYRTAKQRLADGGFATFRRTPKGTIGRLCDARLFEVLPEGSDGRSATVKPLLRQSGGEQTTTNEERIRTTRTQDRLLAASAPQSAEGKGQALPAAEPVSDSANERSFGEECARRFRPPIEGRNAGGFGAADLPKPGPKSKVSKQREQQLMGRLRELLGEEEMRTCGGHWRENWVRKDPELLMRGIVDLTATLEEEEALRRGGHVVENPIQNRAAYLTTLLKDWKIKQAAAVAAQGKETKR